jgi:hypothetical protein
VAANLLKPYVDAATPYVAEAARTTVKVASPLVEKGAQVVVKELKDSGIDVDAAVKNANAAAQATLPVVKTTASALSSFAEAVANGDPATVATAVGAGVLVTLLAPVLLPVLAGCAACIPCSFTAEVHIFPSSALTATTSLQAAARLYRRPNARSDTGLAVVGA